MHGRIKLHEFLFQVSTPLLHAVLAKHFDIVKYLLDNNATTDCFVSRRCPLPTGYSSCRLSPLLLPPLSPPPAASLPSSCWPLCRVAFVPRLVPVGWLGRPNRKPKSSLPFTCPFDIPRKRTDLLFPPSYACCFLGPRLLFM